MLIIISNSTYYTRPHREAVVDAPNNKYTQPHLVVAGKWDLFQLTVKMMKWTQCVLEIWVLKSALERRVVRGDEVGPLLKETVEGTSSWMLR